MVGRAVSAAHDHFQPHAAILITAMVNAAERGFHTWNWGGTWTSQTGVYRFKRKWGARETSYRYFTQVNDVTLLQQTPQQLLDEYPDFYVVPFSALRREAA